MDINGDKEIEKRQSRQEENEEKVRVKRDL